MLRNRSETFIAAFRVDEVAPDVDAEILDQLTQPTEHLRIKMHSPAVVVSTCVVPLALKDSSNAYEAGEVKKTVREHFRLGP